MRRWWWFPVVLFLLWPLGQWCAALYVDWLWFHSLDYASVLLRRWEAKIFLLGLVGGATFLIIWLNLRATGPQLQAEDLPLFPTWGGALSQRLQRGSVWLAWGLGLVAGLVATSQWDEWLLFRHADSFSLADPVFHRDVGFYLFRLPMWVALYRWASGVLLITLGLVLLLQGAQRSLPVWGEWGRLSGRVCAHLSLLGAALLLVKAWGYGLQRFELLTHSSGAVFGAGYTDVHLRIPLLQGLAGVACLAALALLANLRLRRLPLLLVPPAIWLALAVVGGGLLPFIYQRFVVVPNEVDRETPYLRHNIRFTRIAFGLDRLQESLFEVEEKLTPQVIAANRPTIDNIRLWDERPLLPTFAQLQEIRPYYRFLAVDNDRYFLQGRYRQVALSAREMDASLVPGARTWVNQHLIYTHGHGVCVAPVNEATSEGLPRFFVQDIPPLSRVDLRVTRPEIYFGELAAPYVLVRIRPSETTREFDYPAGAQNVYTSYAGEGGIPAAGLFRRLALALRFNTVNLLLTRAIADETRILFYRNIVERARRLAPFLEYDQDPYLVVRADGRLFWVLDAYTVSRAFPYSEPFRRREPFLERTLPRGRRLLPGGINYLRNAVKVTVDAYHGQVAFYTNDPHDPLLATYARIFPDLFQSTDAMPEWLRQHRRYPQDLFLTQALVYRRYHMTEPQAFYNQEDLWSLPNERYGDAHQSMMPYYVVMRLPAEQRAEFLLMLPFTPAGTPERPKDNMIAWMAARCDGDRYGEVRVFRFPKRKLIYGPMQIEARINQDPVISAELTLWHQKGSQVERGNLLVIPIERSLLYVEPLYLRAESQALPELKRVIVAYADRLVMEPTLDQALAALFQAGGKPRRGPWLGEGGEAGHLARQALDSYRAAQRALAEGNYEAYGSALRELETRLIKLHRDLQSLSPPSGL